MISPYYEFIVEQLLLEAKLTYSNNFRDILISLKSPIAEEILKLNNKEVEINTNHIELTNKEDVISFKPENKTTNKRSEIKVGRFAKGLLDKAGFKPTDKDIEQFVNQFKAEFKILKSAFEHIEIVSGDDIKTWYDGENYDSGEGGSLLGSCMRYKKCQYYFDIYTQNPNQVSLIIYKSETDKSKIRGRALLWTDVLGRKFMDRIYTIADSDIGIFIRFAEQNNFIYKSEQESSEYTDILQNDVVIENKVITVALENNYFDYYPYLDTLKFYSASDGKLSNSDDIDYEYKLEDTDGGNGSCDSCSGEGTEECHSCEGSGEISCDDCDGSGEIRCKNCGGEGEFDCSSCEGSGEQDCSTCDGSGKDPDNDELECPECEGKCKEDCSACDGTSHVDCDECNGGEIECTSCGGSGENECYNCEGSGSVDCHECT